MSSEFDDIEQYFEEFEEDFEEFDSEYEELEAELDAEFPIVRAVDLTEVKVRTAVLMKNEMIALLCLKTADQGGAICRVDPRESAPAVQIYDDPDKAEEWFSKSLNSSLRNGWNVVYDGLPLKG
ncbi:MAG: hypothetical protein IPM63_00865 [Acidobacteriota bacterium]|nr:MAG: hypothetical protein IPM63_00865 [Acidobacteriota bacterium]